MRSGASGSCDTFGNPAPLPLIASPLRSVKVVEQAISARTAAASPRASPRTTRRYLASSPTPTPTLPLPNNFDGFGSTDGATSVPTAQRMHSSTDKFTRFAIDALEVWALDEYICRTMASCADHVRVPMHREEAQPVPPVP